MKMIESPSLLDLGPVRFSYVSLFEPRYNESKKEDIYSVQLLIPKRQTEQTFLLDAAGELRDFLAAINDTFAAKFGQNVKIIPENHPVQDGDKKLKADGITPKQPGYWTVNASAKAAHPPKIVNGRGEPIKEGLYSGCWGKARLSLYAYDHNGKRSVGVGVRGVQFLYNDTPFGSIVDVKFDAVAGAHEVPNLVSNYDDHTGVDPFQDNGGPAYSVEDDPFND